MSNLLFTNHFPVNQQDTRWLLFWTSPGTRYQISNIRELQTHKGGGLMIWTRTAMGMSTDHHTFPRTTTTLRYRDNILAQHVLPLFQSMNFDTIFAYDIIFRQYLEYQTISYVIAVTSNLLHYQWNLYGAY